MYDSFSFTDPVFLIGLLIGVGILLVPYILFLLTLQRTMQIILPEFIRIIFITLNQGKYSILIPVGINIEASISAAAQ